MDKNNEKLWIVGGLALILVLAAAIGAYNWGQASVIIPTCEVCKVCPEPDYSGYEAQITALNDELDEAKADLVYFLDEYEDDLNEDEAWSKALYFIKENYIHELEIDDELEDDEDKEDWYTQITVLEKDIDEDDGDYNIEAYIRVDFFDKDGEWQEERYFNFEVEVRESGFLKYDYWDWD